MTFKHLVAAIGVTVASLPAFAQSGGGFSALRLRASTTWADNLSRTSHGPTQKSGEYQTVELAAGYTRQLSRDWLLLGAGEVQVRRVDDFNALSNITGTGTLKLRRKFGLGPFAPVLEFNSALAVAEFDEDGRSGWQCTGGIGLSKRLTETLNLSANAAAVEYFARHPVHDVSTRKLTLEGGWDITNRWRLTLGGGRIWGQFVANAAWAVWGQAISGQLGPVVAEHYNTLAWAVTDTFGPGWVAYRVRDSHADMGWAELSPALTDRTSLSLRYEFARVTNGIGIKYDSSHWTLGLNHQF